MSIPIACSECDWTASAADDLRGKSVKCRQCGAAVPVGKLEPPQAKSLPSDSAHTSSIRRKSRSTNQKQGRWLVPAVVGGLAVAGVAVLLMAAVQVIQRADSIEQDLFGETGDVREYDDPQAPFALNEIPIPTFPQEISFAPLPGEDGVMLTQFSLNAGENPNLPGGAMTLRIYRPAGQFEPGSLPCVLVAPAGTPLIHGNAVDAPDYHLETLPYVKAGMVAIMYSLDGPVPDEGTDRQLQEGYLKFRAAQAGLINARNALGFALAKLPEVNPHQIFCAGHSSAGTLAMLFSAHEPRLAGGLCYCGALDLEKRLREITTNSYLQRMLPGSTSFIQRTSPKTHFSRMQCPVFIFHARDDSNCPFGDAEQMAELLKAAGKPVVFSPVETGNHSESMLEEGIPRGIQWIKSQLAAN